MRVYIRVFVGPGLAGWRWARLGQPRKSGRTRETETHQKNSNIVSSSSNEANSMIERYRTASK